MILKSSWKYICRQRRIFLVLLYARDFASCFTEKIKYIYISLIIFNVKIENL